MSALSDAQLPGTDGRRIFTVANVARGLARRIDELPTIWVAGDLSELNRNDRWATAFLTLKDPEEGSTLRVTIARWALDQVTPALEAGSHVMVYGRPSLFERTCELSLRATRIERAGDGAVLARIEEARRRLAADGLLDESRKRPLPFWPRRIGLICGREAAAPRDVMENAWLRFPAARFVTVETAVQGSGAVAGISAALARLDAEPDVDVIVVTRGGGSLEDLLPFSDEALCRAIAACSTPVVSAIGHERDVPLCDLVADARASTPTGAARLIVPDRNAELENLARLRSAAEREGRRALRDARLGLEALAARPELCRPGLWVERRRGELAERRVRLDRLPRTLVEARRRETVSLADRLRALSPQATLERGYAIALAPAPVRDASELSAGQAVELRLARGSASVRVEEVRPGGS
jgi:exodeoxyribonuclease VII large subunit